MDPDLAKSRQQAQFLLPCHQLPASWLEWTHRCHRFGPVQGSLDVVGLVFVIDRNRF